MKLLLLLLGFIWIRATFPRLRIDQLTRLSWKFLVPLALANLLNGGLWAATSDWTGAAGVARWVVSALLVVVPFVVLGRSLTAGYGPRIYRYASP